MVPFPIFALLAALTIIPALAIPIPNHPKMPISPRGLQLEARDSVLARSRMLPRDLADPLVARARGSADMQELPSDQQNVLLEHLHSNEARFTKAQILSISARVRGPLPGQLRKKLEVATRPENPEKLEEAMQRIQKTYQPGKKRTGNRLAEPGPSSDIPEPGPSSYIPDPGRVLSEEHRGVLLDHLHSSRKQVAHFGSGDAISIAARMKKPFPDQLYKHLQLAAETKDAEKLDSALGNIHNHLSLEEGAANLDEEAGKARVRQTLFAERMNGWPGGGEREGGRAK